MDLQNCGEKWCDYLHHEPLGIFRVVFYFYLSVLKITQF